MFKEEIQDRSTDEYLFLLIWSLLLLPITIVIRAWAVTILWSWSLVTIGVPQISLVAASMLMCLYTFVDNTSYKIKNTVKNDIEDCSTAIIAAKVFGRCILLPPTIIGFAWIIRWVLIAFFGE